MESWIMYIDHIYCIEQLKQFAVFLLTHTQTTLKTTPLPFPPLPSSPFPSSPLLSPPQVSAWGGYVFIINLIPLHIFALLLMGRYSSRIYVGECRALCRFGVYEHTPRWSLTLLSSPPLPLSCPSLAPPPCPSPAPPPPPAYTTFYIMGLLMSMQVPFVGFQPIRTSEHMAAAGVVA